jgi:hypothetical protein
MTVSTDTLHFLIGVFSWLALVSTLVVMLGIYLEGGSRINDVEYPMHVKLGERLVLFGVMGEFGFGITSLFSLTQSIFANVLKLLGWKRNCCHGTSILFYMLSGR